MKTIQKAFGVVLSLVLSVAGALTARADWVPTTGGTYDYGASANWSGSVTNNVFLPSSYAGSAQTITIASDGAWNSNATVVTSHTNVTTLLLKATGSDRNLVLGGGVTYQCSFGGEVNNWLQFGTVTAGEKINFTLPGTVTVQANSDACWYPQVIFNGALGGAGGLNKTGQGSLYLQNAASTFTGTLNIGAGQVVLPTTTATLSTENIIIGRQDAYCNNSLAMAGVIGLLALGNGPAFPPVGTTVGATGANANRVSDTATVDMRGANIRLTAKDGELNNLTETVGTVKLTRGVNGLTVSQAPYDPNTITNNVVTLAITNLTRVAGTALTAMNGAWNLAGPGAFGTGAAFEGRVTLGAINGAAPAASVVNGIIPWAVHGTQVSGYWWASLFYPSFLTYDNTYGLTPVTSYVTDITTAGPTDNVNPSSDTTLAADRTINSLVLNGKELLGSSTVTLNSGALYMVGNKYRLSVSAKLNFGGQEAMVFLQQERAVLDGILSNTGGKGFTYCGLGGSHSIYYYTPTETADLWLQGVNTYTGPTTINGGLLRAGGVSLPSTTAVVINEGGALDLHQYSTTTIGSLSGVGHVWFYGFIIDGLDVRSINSGTLTVGTDNTSTTYAGAIDDSLNLTGYVGHVVKTGTGVLTLSRTNSYSGTTTVSGGGLVIDGKLGACSNLVTVQASAFLGGTGTIARDVVVNSGALLTAGLTNTIGTLNISSNLSLQSGAILNVQLGRTGVCDRIVVGGTVNLNSNSGVGSTLQLSVVAPLRGYDKYTIIGNQSGSAVQGAFANANPNTLVAGGYHFEVAYDGGSGHDVVLTVLPKATVISIH